MTGVHLDSIVALGSGPEFVPIRRRTIRKSGPPHARYPCPRSREVSRIPHLTRPLRPRGRRGEDWSGSSTNQYAVAQPARHPRFHLHFTPTYASWLNQVERWFGILTQREIRRGSFATTKQLIARIETFVANCNSDARPFLWTATADEILQKAAANCKVINGTRH